MHISMFSLEIQAGHQPMKDQKSLNSWTRGQSSNRILEVSLFCLLFFSKTLYDRDSEAKWIKLFFYNSGFQNLNGCPFGLLNQVSNEICRMTSLEWNIVGSGGGDKIKRKYLRISHILRVLFCEISISVCVCRG